MGRLGLAQLLSPCRRLSERRIFDRLHNEHHDHEGDKGRGGQEKEDRIPAICVEDHTGQEREQGAASLATGVYDGDRERISLLGGQPCRIDRER